MAWNNSIRFLFILIIYLLFVHQCTSNCYFPIEFQGNFLIQAQVTEKDGERSVLYSEITIEWDALPPWGQCYKRRGNNVILKDTTGQQDCMRCFHVTAKSANIITIHTQALGKCYTNEQAARLTCPTEHGVKERQYTQIIFYRKYIPQTIPLTEASIFCPINGQYRFTYLFKNHSFYCHEKSTSISNCPKGDVLNINFGQCSALYKDIPFLCLGDWENQNGERYLALMDLRDDVKMRPKYRCALYREDPITGKVYMSLSEDSTCSNGLKSSIDGYESFVLTPINSNTLTNFEKVKCRFSEWAQGKWEKAKIDGNIFKFRDIANQHQTLTSTCIQRQNIGLHDRFIVHSVSQCGKQYYTCIWMKRRSTNILEFQFSSKKSPNYNFTLCNNEYFKSNQWITQGRKNVAMPTACPIMGDYKGVVPGDNRLCAKVSSDCNNPDIMFYTVSNCENRSHIYEEREYRCLGNWEEDGILYTYTQRRDMPGFQCFAGKILGNGEEVYIREAGDGCARGEDPQIYGMKISKKGSCPRPHLTSYISMRSNLSQRPKIIPQKSPSLNEPIRPFVSQPIPQSIFPMARSTVTKDPHWYQADVPSNKVWKYPTIRPFIHPQLKRNSAYRISSLEITLYLIILSIFINR